MLNRYISRARFYWRFLSEGKEIFNFRGVGFFSELDKEVNGKFVDLKVCIEKVCKLLIIFSNILFIFKRLNLR